MLVNINLLPEKEKERSQLLFAALAIIGAAVLLWLVVLILSNGLAKETEQLEGQLVTLQASQEEIRTKLRQAESGDEKQLLASTVGWAEAYQFDTVPLLRELIKSLPERGFFQSFNFTGPNVAQVTVQFDTKPDSAHYFTRLKSSPFISEIHLDSVKVEDLSAEEAEEAANVLPRFLVVYSIQFIDQRVAAEGTATTTDEENLEQNQDEGDDTGD